MKSIKKDDTIHCYIPHILTTLRIAITFSFLYLYFLNFISLTISIFVFAVITDIFDGIIARRLDVCSIFGSYFDAVADFFLIITVFIVFVIDGIYHYWLLILIGFMFMQFLITSRFEKLIYDPVGRYIFLFLIIIVFITFISAHPLVCSINCVMFIGFCIVSLISRYSSLSNSLKNSKKMRISIQI